MPLKATGEDAKLLQPKFVLKNRVGEFKQELISLADLQEFYSLNSIKQKPKDRPYAWSMTVGSLDGIISFKEKNSEGPEEIALKHIKNSGGGSDWRLLNAGWMFADAILATGSILRSEPEGVYTPHFEDLLDCRVKILKKKTRHPYLLVLSGTGNVELSHPCFNNKDIRVIILTTKSGEQHFKTLNELNEQKSPKPKKTLGERKEANKLPEHVVIEVLETAHGDPDSIDFTKAFAMLRNKYDIQYLDVTAGGKTIAALMHEKLIDEFRLTIASQLIGPLTTTGQTRPTVFHLPENMHFTAENNPIVRYDGIRYYGYHHLFIRSSIFYRHGLEKPKEEEEDDEAEKEDEEEEEEEKTEETTKRKRGRPPVQKSPKREAKKDEEEEEEEEDEKDEEEEEEEEEVVIKKTPKKSPTKTSPKRTTPSKRGRKSKR